MTNSKHVNNKTRKILLLGQDFMQEIDDTTIYAEKCIHLILLLLIKNGDDSYYLSMAKKSSNLRPKTKAH